MARRFILVEVGNDTAAVQLREQVHYLTTTEDIAIVGEFLRPDDFCDHSNNWVTEAGRPTLHQMELKEVGWRICMLPGCMKPIPSMSYLRNQIKPADIKNPEHEIVAGKDIGFYVYGISASSLAVDKFKR